MALFGEKYGDEVRVVSDRPASARSCAAARTSRRTGDIGVCKIVYEGSISAGVRRIEAITGEGALRQYPGIHRRAAAASPRWCTRPSRSWSSRSRSCSRSRTRARASRWSSSKNKLAQAAAGDLESAGPHDQGRRRCWPRGWTAWTAQQLRTLADSLRNKWKTAVVVLASAEDSNVSIVCGRHQGSDRRRCTPASWSGAVAQAVGGKGGGRPDMAEGGGKDPSALAGALDGRLRDGREQCCERANRSTPSSSAPGPPASPAASSCKQRGVQTRADRQGLRGQFALPLPHQHGVLHHAGAARNRRHPDDLPEREAQPHRGAQVLSPRGRSLQARHPPVRARRPHHRATTARFRSTPPTGSAAAHRTTRARVILATGYYDVPNLLNVPGEDLRQGHPLLQGAASLLQSRRGRDRREELRRHRRAGAVLDRRARHADSSRRRHLTTT